MRARVRAVIRLVCANTKRGTPSKRHEVMNPARYHHLVELMRVRRPLQVAVVRAAEQRINASGWLKKPALAVTCADLVRLKRARPWRKP